MNTQDHPVEIDKSLSAFRRENGPPQGLAFVVMRFGSTPNHRAILNTIRECLSQVGLKALRSDDKEYHPDLFLNIMTYLHGCGFAIAVFERLEEEQFNPNVSFEVGYMYALGKHVCLLKDRTLRTLQTDIVGQLYRSFDPLQPEVTIRNVLVKWLTEKGLIANEDSNATIGSKSLVPEWISDSALFQEVILATPRDAVATLEQIAQGTNYDAGTVIDAIDELSSAKIIYKFSRSRFHREYKLSEEGHFIKQVLIRGKVSNS